MTFSQLKVHLRKNPDNLLWYNHVIPGQISTKVCLAGKGVLTVRGGNYKAFERWFSYWVETLP
jgi:hypothetical protein